jgi:pyridoxal phosphate enzyme (YggS family)
VSLLANDETGAIRSRLLAVREAIAAAAAQAGRPAADITLIGVSKLFSEHTALAAWQCGLADLGENRVQELLPKQDWLAQAGARPNWHLIGTLQRNKVRQVIGRTALIHSVDSLSLLDEISRRSQAAGLITDVLLQVNATGEASKHGFAPLELDDALAHGWRLPGVRIRGLMTMAQQTAFPEETVPVFTAVKNAFERAARRPDCPDGWTVLSMGMSQDFAQAIRCGATHVRVGSAIFGPRPL